MVEEQKEEVSVGAVIVRSDMEAAALLESANGGGVRLCISIGNPASFPPASAMKLAARGVPVLWCQFADTEDESAPYAAGTRHVEEIVEFLGEELLGLDTNRGEKLLVQDRDGGPRACAVALIAWAMLADVNEQTRGPIAQELLRRPTPPNLLVADIADDVLSMQGRLARLAETVRQHAAH